jgi:hypothetical protein
MSLMEKDSLEDTGVDEEMLLELNIKNLVR